MKKVRKTVCITVALIVLMCSILPGSSSHITAASRDAQVVVNLALSKVGNTYPNGYCLAFVKDMFKSAYGFTSSACCAYKYGSSYIDSTSRSNIPMGASVFFAGSSKTCRTCGNKCGHIGIYVGDDYVVHAWSGKIVKYKIDRIVKAGYPYRGWGWHGNYDLSSNVSTNPDDYPVPTKTYNNWNGAMTGDQVKWIQAVLCQLGYNVAIDGSFGPSTAAQVKKFQSDHGLEADGSAGPATRAKLKECWNNKKNGVTPTPTPDPTPTLPNPDDYPEPTKTYNNWNGAMKGDQVKWIQAVLCQLGYSVTVDGSFGPATAEQMKKFQSDNGLEVDGSAGPATRAKLKECWNKKKYGSAQISFSTDYLELGLTGNNTKTVTGKISGWYAHWQNDWDPKFVAIQRTQNNNEFSWTITARAVGVTEMVLKAQDESENTIVEKKLTIAVECNHSGGVEIRNQSNATCSQPGYTGDTYCSVCGELLITGTLTPMPEHNYVRTVMPATQTDFGYTEYTCSACGDSFRDDYNYLITYNANGGVGAPQSQIRNEGETVQLSGQRPTRDGYTFICWSTNQNATYETVSSLIDDSYYPSVDYSSDNILNLYAVWKANSYTISYNGNGGINAPTSQEKYHGTDITVSSGIPVKEYTVTYDANGGTVADTVKTVNCSFKNWLCDYDGNTYCPGANLSVNANAVMTALWENPMAGVLAVPTKQNCVFLGWFTEKEGGEQVTDTYKISGNTTIYAHWQAEPATDNPYKIVVESKNVIINNVDKDEVTVFFTLQNMPKIKSLAISNLKYNSDVLELVSFNWSIDGVLKSWNGSKGAFTSDTDCDFNGNIVKLTFKIKSGIENYAGQYTISCEFSARQADGTVVKPKVVPGVIIIEDVMVGDLDGNGNVNEDDAIYLLYSTFFPEEYPLNQNCDFDKNGRIDEDDAIYVLYYTFFPDEYPIDR